MQTFQLSGDFVSISVTTTPALLAVPDGINGFIVTNPDATNSIFVHLQRRGTAAPSAAVNLRGIRVYPGTSLSVTIAEGAFGQGCDTYVASNASTITAHAYGVV